MGHPGSGSGEIDQVDTPAFSDQLSALDDPLRRRGLESRPYDREGISARRLALIKRGVPKAVYADAYSGAKARLPIATGPSSNDAGGAFKSSPPRSAWLPTA
jgi:PmbA protein